MPLLQTDYMVTQGNVHRLEMFSLFHNSSAACVKYLTFQGKKQPRVPTKSTSQSSFFMSHHPKNQHLIPHTQHLYFKAPQQNNSFSKQSHVIRTSRNKHSIDLPRHWHWPSSISNLPFSNVEQQVQLQVVLLVLSDPNCKQNSSINTTHVHTVTVFIGFALTFRTYFC